MLLGGNFLGVFSVGPIWFLPVLFLSEIVFHKINNIDGFLKKFGILLAIWCLGHFMAINFRIFYPLRISVVSVGVAYCAVGYVFAHYYKESKLLFLFSIAIVVTYIIGKFVLNIEYFRYYALELAIDWYHDYILDLIIPTGCFVILYWICRFITNSFEILSQLLSELGRYTLTILGLHILIRNIILQCHHYNLNLQSQTILIILCLLIPYLLGKFVFNRNRYLKVLT